MNAEEVEAIKARLNSLNERLLEAARTGSWPQPREPTLAMTTRSRSTGKTADYNAICWTSSPLSSFTQGWSLIGRPVQWLPEAPLGVNKGC